MPLPRRVRGKAGKGYKVNGEGRWGRRGGGGECQKSQKKIWLHLEWSMRGQEKGKHISGVVNLEAKAKDQAGAEGW